MNWSETSITQYTVNGLIWIYELQWGQHHTDYRRKRKWIYELEWNKHHTDYRKNLMWIYDLEWNKHHPAYHKRADVNLWTEMRQASHRLQHKTWCKFMNWNETSITQYTVKGMIRVITKLPNSEQRESQNS